MIIRLRVKNFRRFNDQTFKFYPGVNTIHGENNVGKTSILYAIEYVLFGRIGHFRALNALMSAKARSMGVEIVFQGKDKRFYQLQRIHIIPPKAKTKVLGHYTLKMFSFDPRESKEPADQYLLSSDFQDREELLTLKLQEILGISHKLFDIAIHLRQGEITHILEGSSKLDVVLGITAAVLTADELRTMALMYEKETKALGVYEETKKRLTANHSEIKADQKRINKELSVVEQDISELLGITEIKSNIEKLRQPLFNAHKKLNQLSIDLQKNNEQLIQNEKDLSAEISESGSVDKMSHLISSSEAECNQLQLKKEAESTIQKKLNQQQRELDLKRGDLMGRIKRRESLPNETGAICESCGQVIDTDHNHKEIELWNKDCTKIEAELATILSQQNKVKATLSEIENSLTEQRLQQQQWQSQKKKIVLLEQQNTALKNKNKDLLVKNREMINSLREAIAQYQEEIKCLEIVEKFRPVLALTIPLKEVNSKHINEEGINQFNNEVKQALQALTERFQLSIVKAETELASLQQNKTRMEKENKTFSSKIKALEAEIASTQIKIDEYRHKLLSATKLRNLAEGFKQIQTQLRDQSSTVLAQKTLQIYQQLSLNNKALKKLTIDKKSYSVQVTSSDTNKAMPAALSEGGGHKLLLGIAYKLAIGQVVGPCPFVLLDEPTYGLDKIRKNNLFNQLNQLDNSQMIIISHDIETSGAHIYLQRQGKFTVQTESSDK